MLATYASTAAICGLSLAVGRLVCGLGGAMGWTWLEPGAGLATLLCVAWVAVRLPGHGWTALSVLVLLALAGLALPRRRPGASAGRGGSPSGWDAAAVAILVLALVSVPFLLSGRFGLLGAGINADLGFHLAWAEALATGQDVNALIVQIHPSGYPIAPHAVAAALARPLGVLPAFTGFLMAVPILTALTALAALRDLRRGWRIAGAVGTGLPYMAASYFAEGSFKEPALALLVLTFVLALAGLRAPVEWRRGLVPGLAVVAAVLTFGSRGLAWPLAIVAIWLALELLARIVWLRRMAPLLLAVGAVLAAAALAATGQLQDTTSTGTGTGLAGGGNFPGQISPWHVFGGWPEPDFRLPANHEFWVGVATAVALAAVACGAVRSIRRRELVLPAAVIASLIVYWVARVSLKPYFSAKGLVVAAPLITLLAVRGAFAELPGPERLRSPSGRIPVNALRALLGVAFLAIVGWSSLLALRNAEVSATGHGDELRSLRPLLRQGPTVLLETDDNARWELLGVRLSDPVSYGFLPDVRLSWRPGKFPPYDFDSLTSKGLDRFRFAVTVRGPYASDPPPNWRLIRTTRSFQVWKRSGRTPIRATLPGEGDAPGALFDCSTRPGRVLSRRGGVAAVRPAPVVGPAPAWRRPGGVPAGIYTTGITSVSPGVTARQVLRLAPGRWDLSLQYSSPVPLDVAAGRLRAHLPAVTDPLAQFWPVGAVSSSGRRVAVRVNVNTARTGAIGRLGGLGKIVATRAPWRVAQVPLRAACGRYVDWVELNRPPPAPG